MRKAAFETGTYRNLFLERGHTQQQVDSKIEETFQQLFFGDDETRFFYQTDEGLAYMLDTGNNDARTEGMSYGMMMCVQMDRQDLFDQLWGWSVKYMQHREGKYKGYFAWSLNTDGTHRAEGPAPDGEEYFALALFFAWKRWGDKEPPYDYSVQARAILHECVHKGEDGQEGDPMWDPGNKLIKFVPEAEFTDPSYHLPHFYELFALYADEVDRPFWAEAAKASREYIKTACHPVTGLAPDYSHYDGRPYERFAHELHRADAYRVAMNLGLDWEWYGKDDWNVGCCNRIQAYFAANVPDHHSYKIVNIDGTPTEEGAMHTTAPAATAGCASLAADGPHRDMYIDVLWNMPIHKGLRRYYDNCLYFFSLLAVSGKYRIY